MIDGFYLIVRHLRGRKALENFFKATIYEETCDAVPCLG